jgi:uncharacterized protein YqeY
MLYNQIKSDRIAHLKSGDKAAATTLVTLLGELSRLDSKDPSDAQVVGVIQKMLKGIEDMQKVRPSEELTQEAATLKAYLPQLLSEEELISIIAEARSNGITVMGELMKHLKDNYAGRYDGKLAAGLCK